MANWPRSLLRAHRKTRIGFGWQAAALVAGAYALKRLVDARRNRLTGRVVLITGGSRGLGLLLARAFGRRGCRLAICARDAAELDRARLGLQKRGFEIYAAVCDVSDATQVEQLVAEVLDHYGRIDVLVNNAGMIQVGALDSLHIDDFRLAMAVNFWGTVNTSLAALEALKRQPGGRLVNICSIGGKVAMPHLLPHDCAKFAVLGFSEGLRAELDRDGVSVTTVIPGLMRTGSFASATFKGDKQGEFGWFSALALEHATTLDARKAARAIVRATARRQPELILGWQARLLALAKALFPGPVARGLAFANRTMPRSTDQSPGLTGRTLAANPARHS